MKKLWVMDYAFILLAVICCGCREESCAELEGDLRNVSERLKVPGPYALEFGNGLGNKIFNLSDPRLRRKYQAKYEHMVLSVVFDSSDYDLRMHQFRSFDTFADCCMCGMLRWDEKGALNTVMWSHLRLLKRTMQERKWAESQRNRGVPFRPGVHVSPDHYADSVTRSLNSRAERFETLYNDYSGKLTKEQKAMIEVEFMSIMGYNIRTDEDIARDRQRKIDAKIEEARRRQEERLGNDVRVDIDSL